MDGDVFVLTLIAGGISAAGSSHIRVCPECARKRTRTASACRRAGHNVEGSVQGSNRACQGLCDTLAASADLGCVSESTTPFKALPSAVSTPYVARRRLVLHCC